MERDRFPFRNGLYYWTSFFSPSSHRGQGFPGTKESAYSAGDPGLIPGSGRSSGEGNGTYSSMLAWEIPWTEEPGGLLSMGS